MFVEGMLTAGCPGGSVVTPAGSGPGWTEELESLVEFWVGVAVDLGAVTDALPTVFPSRKPRMAPSSRPTTPTRAAMANVVDWSALPAAAGEAAGAARAGAGAA